jgi:hypothetical protein
MVPESFVGWLVEVGASEDVGKRRQGTDPWSPLSIGFWTRPFSEVTLPTSIASQMRWIYVHLRICVQIRKLANMLFYYKYILKYVIIYYIYHYRRSAPHQIQKHLLWRANKNSSDAKCRNVWFRCQRNLECGFPSDWLRWHFERCCCTLVHFHLIVF